MYMSLMLLQVRGCGRSGLHDTSHTLYPPPHTLRCLTGVKTSTALAHPTLPYWRSIRSSQGACLPCQVQKKLLRPLLLESPQPGGLEALEGRN